MEKISRSMKENQVTVQLLCAGCDDIIVRPMRLGVKEQVDCLVVYIESAVSNMMLEDSVIGKLLNHLWELDEEEIRRAVEENGLGISDVKELETMEECMAALLAGNAISMGLTILAVTSHVGFSSVKSAPLTEIRALYFLVAAFLAHMSAVKVAAVNPMVEN